MCFCLNVWPNVFSYQVRQSKMIKKPCLMTHNISHHISGHSLTVMTVMSVLPFGTCVSCCTTTAPAVHVGVHRQNNQTDSQDSTYPYTRLTRSVAREQIINKKRSVKKSVPNKGSLVLLKSLTAYTYPRTTKCLPTCKTSVEGGCLI